VEKTARELSGRSAICSKVFLGFLQKRYVHKLFEFLAPYLVGWGNFSKFVSRNGAAALFYLIEKVLLKLSS
jgi:hypothetical protein